MPINFSLLPIKMVQFTEEVALPSLTSLQKRVLVVAAIALSCLAAVYLFRKCCFKTTKETPQLANDQNPMPQSSPLSKISDVLSTPVPKNENIDELLNAISKKHYGYGQSLQVLCENIFLAISINIDLPREIQETDPKTGEIKWLIPVYVKDVEYLFLNSNHIKLRQIIGSPRQLLDACHILRDLNIEITTNEAKEQLLKILGESKTKELLQELAYPSKETREQYKPRVTMDAIKTMIRKLAQEKNLDEIIKKLDGQKELYVVHQCLKNQKLNGLELDEAALLLSTTTTAKQLQKMLEQTLKIHIPIETTDYHR